MQKKHRPRRSLPRRLPQLAGTCSVGLISAFCGEAGADPHFITISGYVVEDTVANVSIGDAVWIHFVFDPPDSLTPGVFQGLGSVTVTSGQYPDAVYAYCPSTAFEIQDGLRDEYMFNTGSCLDLAGAPIATASAALSDESGELILGTAFPTAAIDAQLFESDGIFITLSQERGEIVASFDGARVTPIDVPEPTDTAVPGLLALFALRLRRSGPHGLPGMAPSA